MQTTKKSIYQLKLLLNNSPQLSGFTLIELIIVVLIIGILSAVALPNFLNQVGKARETEVTTSLGTINRSQIAYHWEQQEFCCTTLTNPQILTALGVSFDSQYVSDYEFDNPDSNSVLVEPININPQDLGLRAFSSSVYYDPITAVYETYLCRSFDPKAQTDAPTDTGACAADAQRIR